MADFCFQCTERVLGVDGVLNDLSGLSTPDDTAAGLHPSAMCEGCGPIQVDHEGRCVSDCFKRHSTENSS